MRLLHELAKIRATFDDPHMVSQATLIPLMVLAQQANLSDLAARRTASMTLAEAQGKAIGQNGHRISAGA